MSRLYHYITTIITFTFYYTKLLSVIHTSTLRLLPLHKTGAWWPWSVCLPLSFVSILELSCAIVTFSFHNFLISLFNPLLLSLSFIYTHSLSFNNALDPPRPLLFPEHLCNKAWISELHRYLTQTAVRGHSVGSFPAGLYLHSSFLCLIPSISESHQSRTQSLTPRDPAIYIEKPPSKS